MIKQNIYEDISKRTGGNIYIGVTGPVRTGKSTFIKRFMEALVIPNIDDAFLKERTRDELPQSGSGKTIMTAEPKFVPEEAIEIMPDDTARLCVRMIDCVGYMVHSAEGATENGQPRMVTTPWYDKELPMTEAAELGTKKVMEDHCTVGLIITSDGSVTDIPREEYIDAESRAISDMKKTGKPFVVLVNSAQQNGSFAQSLAEQLHGQWNVPCIPINCLTMQEADIKKVLKELLYGFPVSEVKFYYPSWLEALESSHALKTELYGAVRACCEKLDKIYEAEHCLEPIGLLEKVQEKEIQYIDLGKGTIGCKLSFDHALFYEILSEKSSLQIEDDADLMHLLTDYSQMKSSYERIAVAVEEAEATGYGIVQPITDQLKLEQPQVIRKGNTYGIRLKASAPSIHMIRTDVRTEISPMVGDEAQSQELVSKMLEAYDSDIETLWQSNIFGKSVYELVNDGLSTKLTKMPSDARTKLKDALTRIVNEGCNGMICLIF